MGKKNNAPNYGNWVSTKLIYVPAALAAVFAALSLYWTPALVGAVLGILSAGYFLYARRQFSTSGGNLQARMRDTVLATLEWEGTGRLLDVGCGNGALAIDAARRHPGVQAVGIDYWGRLWEYSLECCENNARLAAVSERTTFRKASAASLPFPDESFDIVVSNMVFHEVQEAKDKREVVREALRVLKKGGLFVFQDLFLWRAAYGEAQALVSAVRSWGIEEVELIDTSRQSFIPRALKLPFMLGKIGLLHGRK